MASRKNIISSEKTFYHLIVLCNELEKKNQKPKKMFTLFTAEN